MRCHDLPLDGNEHVFEGRCWCGAEHVCVECLTSTPCIHGSERREIVVHRRAS